jgi:predicted RNA-binding Zn-ribbon protein involved in translation (DUF1610 family)
MSRPRKENRKLPKKRRAKDKDVIPTPPPKRILSAFTLSNPTGERAIKDYVESQIGEERVQHLEKVKSEHVFDRDYDCWDVHTDKNRYWVITSPANLYPQRYLASLDFTLSLHIGLTTRVFALQKGAPNQTHRLRLNRVWRKWDDALTAYNQGEEPEDFQSVGLKCRESLIELIRSISKSEMVPSGRETPKGSDVIGWSEFIADFVAAGSSNSNIRSHLKTITKSTWQLDNWLTHRANANRSDARFALDATQEVIIAFGNTVIRLESNSPERCPDCGSYAIGVGYNPKLLPRPYVSECEKCGWQSQEMR